MVYENKFVAVVKCGGQILREHDNVVTLPFLSEYSLLLKNLSTKRCNVDITIDGINVLDNQSIIIDANSDFELEGFLSDRDVRNKFKFIQKTKKIVEHRGDNIDDGIIRISYRFEEDNTITLSREVWYYSMDNYDYRTAFPDPVIRPSHPNIHYFSSSESCISSSSPMEPQSILRNVEPNFDEGITVNGSKSNQSFNYGYIGDLEREEHVIILKLRGVKNDNTTKIKKAILVRKKIKCEICGTRCVSSFKFCCECGNCLV